MTANLDMGGYKILNVTHPRDPRKYESDLVSSKILYDYMSQIDQNYMRRDRDCSFDGRLDMSNNRISGLADPTDADDAVTRRYVASRFQALSDEVQDKKSKLDALQNFLGVVNNQVLIRKYEIICASFKNIREVIHPEREMSKSSLVFTRYPIVDDHNTYEFIDTFTLKEYFFHLFEEPADDVTGSRIKQPGTYAIHFDLIPYSFAFELQTRDEIMHFSEHNPKHDINLEKDENCLLVLKAFPTFIRTGSKIYVYYNI